MAAAARLCGPAAAFSGDRAEFLDALRRALYASKICSYAQGFGLMRAAAAEHGWDLDYGAIAMVWRGGCIIRAKFLSKIKDGLRARPGAGQPAARPLLYRHRARRPAAVARGRGHRRPIGIPVPGLSSALSYYDSYRSATLSANMLQAQRYYFGAHLPPRRPGGGVPHRVAGRSNARLPGKSAERRTTVSYLDETFGLHDEVVALAGAAAPSLWPWRRRF